MHLSRMSLVQAMTKDADFRGLVLAALHLEGRP